MYHDLAAMRPTVPRATHRRRSADRVLLLVSVTAEDTAPDHALVGGRAERGHPARHRGDVVRRARAHVGPPARPLQGGALGRPVLDGDARPVPPYAARAGPAL